MDLKNTYLAIDNAIAGTTDGRDKRAWRILKNDILSSVKFTLDDDFSDEFGCDGDHDFLVAPKLPFNKMFIEAISGFDNKRYGIFIEDHEELGLGGQVFLEVLAEHEQSTTLLFPAGLAFYKEGDFLALHKERTVLNASEGQGCIVALHLMVKAIHAMNCANIEMVEASGKKVINPSCAHNGKLALYKFHTLRVVVNRKESKGETKGTHATPRVHLRRGHVRTIGDRQIWVQPCVVGDKSKGVVHKDYLVSQHALH